MSLNRIHTHLGRLMAVWIAAAGLMAAEHHARSSQAASPSPAHLFTATKRDKKLFTTTDENGRYSFADLSTVPGRSRSRCWASPSSPMRSVPPSTRRRRNGSQVPADERHHGASASAAAPAKPADAAGTPAPVTAAVTAPVTNQATAPVTAPATNQAATAPAAASKAAAKGPAAGRGQQANAARGTQGGRGQSAANGGRPSLVAANSYQRWM